MDQSDEDFTDEQVIKPRSVEPTMFGKLLKQVPMTGETDLANDSTQIVKTLASTNAIL